MFFVGHPFDRHIYIVFSCFQQNKLLTLSKKYVGRRLTYSFGQPFECRISAIIFWCALCNMVQCVYYRIEHLLLFKCIKLFIAESTSHEKSVYTKVFWLFFIDARIIITLLLRKKFQNTFLIYIVKYLSCQIIKLQTLSFFISSKFTNQIFNMYSLKVTHTQ